MMMRAALIAFGALAAGCGGAPVRQFELGAIAAAAPRVSAAGPSLAVVLIGGRGFGRLEDVPGGLTAIRVPDCAVVAGLDLEGQGPEGNTEKTTRVLVPLPAASERGPGLFIADDGPPVVFTTRDPLVVSGLGARGALEFRIARHEGKTLIEARRTEEGRTEAVPLWGEAAPLGDEVMIWTGPQTSWADEHPLGTLTLLRLRN